MNEPRFLLALMALLAFDVEPLADRACVPAAKLRLFLENREPMPKAMYARCCAVAREEIRRRREMAEALLAGPLFTSSPVGCAISPANLEALR